MWLLTAIVIWRSCSLLLFLLLGRQLWVNFNPHVTMPAPASLYRHITQCISVASCKDTVVLAQTTLKQRGSGSVWAAHRWLIRNVARHWRLPEITRPLDRAAELVRRHHIQCIEPLPLVPWWIRDEKLRGPLPNNRLTSITLKLYS
jgi:hypothetical protein